MQITIDVTNESLFETISSFLNQYRQKGVRIIKEDTPSGEKAPDPNEGLDFSSFRIDSFRSVDGLDYQREIRDAW